MQQQIENLNKIENLIFQQEKNLGHIEHSIRAILIGKTGQPIKTTEYGHSYCEHEIDRGKIRSLFRIIFNCNCEYGGGSYAAKQDGYMPINHIQLGGVICVLWKNNENESVITIIDDSKFNSHYTHLEMTYMKYWETKIVKQHTINDIKEYVMKKKFDDELIKELNE